MVRWERKKAERLPEAPANRADRGSPWDSPARYAANGDSSLESGEKKKGCLRFLLAKKMPCT